MSEVPLDIRIRPGIEPDARHTIEDTLERKGCDVAGGGGFGDGSESDIMVYVTDPQRFLPRIIKVLQEARVGEDSVIIEPQSGNLEHRVYADGEFGSPRPWWKLW